MRRMILTILVCVLSGYGMLHAQVGLLTNNPHKSASLDMTGINNKGLLIPTVGLVDIDSPAPIVNNAPETGLLVYNTNVALPAKGNSLGGAGYFYWNGAKWCRMLTADNIGGLDNMGNHTATDILRMSNNHIQNINKLSTTTEAIAQGVDGMLPKVGYVATSADNQGNVVWRPAPLSIAKDTIAFYKESSGAAFFTASYSPWVDLPGLNNFTYTATGSGTLLLQAVVYVEAGSNAGDQRSTNGGAAWMAVYNGAALVDQTFGGTKGISYWGNTAPGKILMQLQVPVVKGVTYTFVTKAGTTTCADTQGYATGVYVGSVPVGGFTVKSYIMGTLLGLSPLPGGFYE